MRVALIAPPWVAVPPPVYGGTERIIDTLARGLTKAGHDVLLLTTADSTCPVASKALYPTALGISDCFRAELGHVAWAYEQVEACDLVHDHTLVGPMWHLAAQGSTPVVTTAHLPLDGELRAMYAAIADRVPIIAISDAQRRDAPDVRIAQVIPHGIDVESRCPGSGDGGYVAFLGRMSPDKGPDVAIRAARRAGLPIRLAAKIWDSDERRFFEEHVRPLLEADAVFEGELSGAAKNRFLGRAVALANPIQWPEPFGLVMIEALACGTPVVTFPVGAAPEIVDDGRTGFLCRDEFEMATRLADAGRLSRRACRRSAESRFSSARMVTDHLDLYEQVLAGRTTFTSEQYGQRRRHQGSMTRPPPAAFRHTA